MKVNDDGSVYLEQGDTFPCFCSCGHVYQPKPDEKFSSGCPKCRRRNIHGDQQFKKAEAN